MRLDTVIIHQVKLPFSFDFSHSLRKRAYVNNIIVEIIAGQEKIIGYGDGSYDEFLLKENVTFENVSFGEEGKADPLSSPGLGVTVSSQGIKNITYDSDTILISTF